MDATRTYGPTDPDTADNAVRVRFATRPVLAVGAVLAVVLTALSGRYGFHRDELYFLAAGQHPDWGYVDQPPLTPLIARASTALFGDSPYGIRVPATLCSAATVVVAAAVARELGAGRRAQVLAAVTTATSAYVLAVGHMLSTSSFDLLAWLVICWTVLRLLRTGDSRWWLAIGAAAGISLQNKSLVVLLVVALLGGMLLTGPRRVFRSRLLVAGAALAVVAALPDIWWQAAHGWPQLTVADGISADDGAENRLLFVPEQIVYLSPLYVPFFVAGWLRLWRDPAVRWARSMAVAYPLLCVLVLLAGGKPYYALPLLIVLMAAGCEPVVRWLRSGRHRVRNGSVAVAVAASAAVGGVVGLPLLPPGAVGVASAVNPEQAEQIGWPALVDAVAAGWARIPAGQRGRAVILAQNYGEAGAIARYGPDRGLPAPYSGHMSFADWGPPPDTADGPVLLIHQDGEAGLERYFRGCQVVARVDNGGNVGNGGNGNKVDNEEQNAPVVLCSAAAQPWSRLWPGLRGFY